MVRGNSEYDGRPLKKAHGGESRKQGVAQRDGFFFVVFLSIYIYIRTQTHTQEIRYYSYYYFSKLQAFASESQHLSTSGRCLKADLVIKRGHQTTAAAKMSMTRLNRPKLIPSPPPTAIRPVDPKFKIRLLCAHYLSVQKLGTPCHATRGSAPRWGRGATSWSWGEQSYGGAS